MSDNSDLPPLVPTTSLKVSVQRKGKRKVSNGCLTCKIRKIKCDETRPYCLRCLRTGRKCDGYPTTSQSSMTLDSAVMQSHPSFDSQKEARAYDFYLKRSSTALSGDLDTELWSRLVTQLSIREPAIKHAALAVSSLHRLNMSRRQNGPGTHVLDLDETFALTQYGKAMQTLRSWKPASGDPDRLTVPLVLCLLFVAVEFLRGGRESSQLHICQGRKILAELREGDLPPYLSQLLKRHLVPMYSRLGLACYLFETVPVPIPSHLKSLSEAENGGKDGIGNFTSIDQARDELYHMVDEVLQFVNIACNVIYSMASADVASSSTNQEMLSLAAQQSELLIRLEQWNTALAMLSVTLPPTALPANTLHLLHIHYHVVKTWVSTALETSEVCFDEHLQAFSSVVSGSAAIINSMGKQSENIITHTFSFETGIIAPLFWTCAKCRHPLLRRAALKLLQREETRARKENNWSIEVTVAISAYLINLEEGTQEPSPQDVTGTWAADNAGSGGEIPAYSYATTDGVSEMSSSTPTATEAILVELLRVPIYQPPTIPVNPDFKLFSALLLQESALSNDPPTPEIPPDKTTTNLAGESMKDLPEFSVSTPSPLKSSGKSASMTMASQQSLAPNFGVPDSARVRSTMTGPVTKEGVWITTFKDPPPGAAEWDVKKKFLPYWDGASVMI